MANIFENRVSTTFTTAEQTALQAQHTAYSNVVNPKTIALTDDELNSLPGIDVSNYVFVKDTLKVTDAEGLAMLPPAYAALVPELGKDDTFYDQLDMEKNWLNNQSTKVENTQRLVASEAVKVAIKIYEQYKNLAEAGVPGAQAKYDVLKARFAGNGGGRQSTPNP